MKTVLLMRHAKSSWDEPYHSDHERPLNARGRHDAPRMGDLLVAEDLTPDVVVCSTARRAKETLAGVMETSPVDEGVVSFSGELYHGDIVDYLEALRSLPEEAKVALLVGHNPDIEYFLSQICGEQEHMTTAAIAQVTFEVARWKDLNEETEGTLVNLWRPREIG
jgi:phosphohistidine phosphatase